MQDILAYWHRLEFFIPFDLDARVKAEGKTTIWIDATDPISSCAKIAEYVPPEGQCIRQQNLFLGVFNTSALVDLSRDMAPKPTEAEEMENQTRSKREGQTCFVRFGLVEGRVEFGGAEISTLPWAIGQVRSRGWDALALDRYNDDMHRLEVQLSEAAQRFALSETPLQDAIAQLMQILTAWAGFSPSGENHVGCVEILLEEARSPSGDATDKRDEEEDDESDEPVELGILNSFYLRDLERALDSVERDKIPGTLAQYLTPVEPQERVDLFSDTGERFLREAVSPERMNRGRWPSPPNMP